MSKCRLIDMEAYSRGEFRIIGENGNKQAHKMHGDLCPDCGQFSVFPEGGCWTCLSCGWSKCNVRR